jgi:hypothetical protein
MRLVDIDWNTLTQTQAARLVGAVDAHEKGQARRFDRDEIDEAAWLASFTLWEDLRVFAISGINPRGMKTNAT